MLEFGDQSARISIELSKALDDTRALLALGGGASAIVPSKARCSSLSKERAPNGIKDDKDQKKGAPGFVQSRTFCVRTHQT